MPKGEKQKKISWAFPLDNSIEESEQKKTPFRYVYKTNAKNYHSFYKTTEDKLIKYLDSNSVDLFLDEVKLLKKTNLLYEVLKNRHFVLFDLILEKQNYSMLFYLFKYLSEKQKDKMIHFDNCSAIRMFIDNIKNLTWDPHFEEVIKPIFQEILNVRSTLEVIKNNLNDQSSLTNSDTLEKLKTILAKREKDYLDSENKANQTEHSFFNQKCDTQEQESSSMEFKSEVK